MRLVAAATALLLIAVAPAAASGGFWCDVEDESVAFSVQGGLAHGIPGGPFSFSAWLRVKLPGVPDDLRDLELGEALAQSWIVDPDLRLQIYYEREGEPFASVELVLATVQSEDDDEAWMYHGAYALTIAELKPGDDEATMIEARGTVSCGVE